MQPFLYLLWYFVFSILGNYNYFFFAAHLIDVAVGVAALRIILEAITHNGKQVRCDLIHISQVQFALVFSYWVYVRVRAAIILNLFQLMLTVGLLTIVVYIYTVIAFNFFRKFYVSEEEEEVDQKCHDMLTVSDQQGALLTLPPSSSTEVPPTFLQYQYSGDTIGREN